MTSSSSLRRGSVLKATRKFAHDFFQQNAFGSPPQMTLNSFISQLLAHRLVDPDHWTRPDILHEMFYRGFRHEYSTHYVHLGYKRWPWNPDKRMMNQTEVEKWLQVMEIIDLERRAVRERDEASRRRKERLMHQQQDAERKNELAEMEEGAAEAPVQSREGSQEGEPLAPADAGEAATERAVREEGGRGGVTIRKTPPKG
ncbi:unnamed protein product [Vitrella brassicaformis CCMP3155]|uniref:Uncharacterized protein n=1 Tax=Vitrella brassicaformis (strain CCMP3155) TaxID=1169540 RepID=A0A0G4FNJ5_VITBC|nr:unnamed protein product [Vitrella brassicaformis CCMP3155]|eukprot:CEM15611.1 unnamed protein product [Vitrella brassicaformis CCMP3155]